MLIDLFKKPVPKRHISPKIRAYGKARIDIARRATSLAEWDQLWKKPANSFIFDWGERWKHCVEYKVDDFAAEVGFYVDILGLPVNAFDPDYAMFTSPGGDFYLAVVPTPEGRLSTAPEGIRIQFMVANLLETTTELERRGITFEQKPQPCTLGSSMCIACFRTPHGISIDLWGVVDPNLLEPGEEDSEAFITGFDQENPLVELVLGVSNEPGSVGEDFHSLVEPDSFVESAGDQDGIFPPVSWIEKEKVEDEPQHPIEAEEPIDNLEAESELDGRSRQPSTQEQLNFFEDDRLDEDERGEDESDEDFGEKFGDDSDDDSDQDATLYEYNYEDDF